MLRVQDILCPINNCANSVPGQAGLFGNIPQASRPSLYRLRIGVPYLQVVFRWVRQNRYSPGTSTTSKLTYADAPRKSPAEIGVRWSVPPPADRRGQAACRAHRRLGKNGAIKPGRTPSGADRTKCSRAQLAPDGLPTSSRATLPVTGRRAARPRTICRQLGQITAVAGFRSIFGRDHQLQRIHFLQKEGDPPFVAER